MDFDNHDKSDLIVAIACFIGFFVLIGVLTKGTSDGAFDNDKPPHAPLYSYVILKKDREITSEFDPFIWGYKTVTRRVFIVKNVFNGKIFTTHPKESVFYGHEEGDTINITRRLYPNW
jgi:hypothetical protein